MGSLRSSAGRHASTLAVQASRKDSTSSYMTGSLVTSGLSFLHFHSQDTPYRATFASPVHVWTIFQGQRANGAVIETEKKYQTGLEAAWSEAMLLDQGALSEPKSAEASLWAIFIISVTTGSTAEYFNKMLSSLLQDLQLQHWPDVRKVLLDFIYPVSFLDEPCRLFFNSISTLQPIGIT